MSNYPKDVLEAYEKAKEAMAKAYSPYSKFKVGACLKHKDGYFAAHNIENVSFPVGCCAETNAIYGAINTVGRIKFDYIVIVADSKDPISPCGICRQVMREHVSDDFKIYMGDSKGIREVKTMKEILPGAITNLD